MEWQTKEYIDERFDEVENKISDVDEKLDLLLNHFSINPSQEIEDDELKSDKLDESDIV